MSRCPSPDCEGWSFEAGDRYCCWCGNELQPVRLEVRTADRSAVHVLDKAAAHLYLTNPTGHPLDLAAWDWPEWLSAQGVLGAGETGEFALAVHCSGELSPVARLQALGTELSLCYSAVPPVTRILTGWGSCEDGWQTLELVLEQGALWLDAPPPGCRGLDPLPVLLHAQERRRWRFVVPGSALDRPLRWEPLGEVRLPPAPPLSRQTWNLQRSLQLELALPDPGVEFFCDGPLEIVPAPEGQAIRVRYLGDPRPGSLRIGVRLQSEELRLFALELQSAPRPAFAGWLVLDYGSSCSCAALLGADGEVRLLELGRDGPTWPSAVRYGPEGALQASSAPGPDVAEDAKRRLGLEQDFLLQAGGLSLRVAPEQVAEDGLNLLLERIDELEYLSFARVCLTCPAAFSPRQRWLLEQALLRVWQRRDNCTGPDQLVLVAEPLAATFAYLTGTELPRRRWRLLGYDLGAGTSDSAWLEVDSRDPGQVSARVYRVGGDRWFGGRDISALVGAGLGESDPVRAEARKLELSRSWPGPQPWDEELAHRLDRGIAGDFPWDPPDRILVSGQASAYPGVRAWLEARFPGVPIDFSAEPKACVVLGAAAHPELVRSLGPRRFATGRAYLSLPEAGPESVCSTRLGIRLVDEAGAHFQPLSELGQPFGISEISPIALLPGSNPIELLENLSSDDRLRLPDGQANFAIVSLGTVILELGESLHPERTTLRWQLDPSYQVRLSVLSGEREVAASALFPLWHDSSR